MVRFLCILALVFQLGSCQIPLNLGTIVLPSGSPSLSSITNQVNNVPSVLATLTDLTQPDNGPGNPGVNISNILTGLAQGSPQLGGSSIGSSGFGSLLTMVANLTKNMTMPPNNCIFHHFPNDVPVISAAVNKELNRCSQNVDQKQMQDITNSATKFLSTLFSSGGNSLIGELTKATLAPSCAQQAPVTYCQLFRKLYNNPKCQICDLMAMTGRSSQIQQCACAQYDDNDNLLENMQKCVEHIIPTGVVRQQYGSFMPDCY